MNETFSSRPHPIILFYNKFFEASPDVTGLQPEDRAAFVWDRSLFAEADAVVFHIPNLVFDTPNLKEIAKLKKPLGQVWGRIVEGKCSQLSCLEGSSIHRAVRSRNELLALR